MYGDTLWVSLFSPEFVLQLLILYLYQMQMVRHSVMFHGIQCIWPFNSTVIVMPWVFM